MVDNHFRFECSALISAVKKRPGIYDRSHPDYKKEEKEQLWVATCEEIIPEWTDFSTPERNSALLILQRKWKNLRDSFRKELNVQKLRSSRSVKKKREYLYFQSLLFLEPFLKEQETTGKNKSSNRLEYYEDQSSVDGIKLESPDSQFSESSNRSSSKKRTKRTSKNWDPNHGNDESDTFQQRRKVSKQAHDTSRLEILEEFESGYLNSNCKIDEAIDEDRYFLLSLLPSMRDLKRETKLSVRIEFLEILRGIIFCSNEDS